MNGGAATIGLTESGQQMESVSTKGRLKPFHVSDGALSLILNQNCVILQ